MREKEKGKVFKKFVIPQKVSGSQVFGNYFFLLQNGGNGWPPIGLKFFVAKVDKKLRPFPTIFPA